MKRGSTQALISLPGWMTLESQVASLRLRLVVWMMKRETRTMERHAAETTSGFMSLGVRGFPAPGADLLGSQLCLGTQGLSQGGGGGRMCLSPGFSL